MLNHLFETHFPGCEEQMSHEVPEFFEGHDDSWAFARKLVTVESIKWEIDSFAPLLPLLERMEFFLPYFKRATRFSNML